ncbi:MAG: VWA domain-containing protein [Acidimicrobiales bacterium]
MPARFSYSRWDGTQTGFDLDAEEVLAQATDDLVYHGDVNAALRRMLQEGLKDRMGERIAGLRELLERLRQRRQAELANHDLGGVYDDIADELREVVGEERAALDALEEAARQSGDQRREEVVSAAMTERRMHLDLLPPDLAGQVRSLSEYDFASGEARQRFEDLMDRLRQELLQAQLSQMSEAMANMTPEQMARLKDMLAALNTMLDRRAAGEDPQFEQFMEQYGDFFPGNPQTLDELLEQMARQMAAMQQFLNSLSPEQRAQLQALSDQLLDDMDLRWQMEQLGQHLRSAMPQAGWGDSWQTSGSGPMGMGEATQLMDRLSSMDQLENLLRSAGSPGALAEADMEVAADLLGPEAARSLERLAELTRMLEEAGLIELREGRLELTPRGLRAVGQRALSDLFARLSKDRLARHQAEREGPGHERTYDSKPYEFGDPFHLDIERTIRNAIGRTGGGTPVALDPEDFAVERTEVLTRTSTVLLLDLSLSMPMRDNFLAAKKVALALHALISSQYPRDYLGIVGFSQVARPLRPEQLPEVSWDFVMGTNMQHALLLARRQLARQSGTRQIVMITDGEPTAHLESDGGVFVNYPPVRETVRATLAEVARCTAEGIRINTFMLDATDHLQAFVERMTRMNKGRAFFTTPETLGSYVLVDFLEHKRAQRGDRHRDRRRPA